MLRSITSRTKKQIDGAKAEEFAKHFLKKQGYRLIEKNFHCRGGEIDLIMLNPANSYVFIEVRFRRNLTHGSALESITTHKYKRCLKAAQYWLMKNNLLNHQYQIDVVAFDGHLNEESLIWLKGI